VAQVCVDFHVFSKSLLRKEQFSGMEEIKCVT
jgi:hypothetical protein